MGLLDTVRGWVGGRAVEPPPQADTHPALATIHSSREEQIARAQAEIEQAIKVQSDPERSQTDKVGGLLWEMDQRAHLADLEEAGQREFVEAAVHPDYDNQFGAVEAIGQREWETRLGALRIAGNEARNAEQLHALKMEDFGKVDEFIADLDAATYERLEAQHDALSRDDIEVAYAAGAKTAVLIQYNRIEKELGFDRPAINARAEQQPEVEISVEDLDAAHRELAARKSDAWSRPTEVPTAVVNTMTHARDYVGAELDMRLRGATPLEVEAKRGFDRAAVVNGNTGIDQAFRPSPELPAHAKAAIDEYKRLNYGTAVLAEENRETVLGGADRLIVAAREDGAGQVKLVLTKDGWTEEGPRTAEAIDSAAAANLYDVKAGIDAIQREPERARLASEAGVTVAQYNAALDAGRQEYGLAVAESAVLLQQARTIQNELSDGNTNTSGLQAQASTIQSTLRATANGNGQSADAPTLRAEASRVEEADLTAEDQREMLARKVEVYAQLVRREYPSALDFAAKKFAAGVRNGDGVIDFSQQYERPEGASEAEAASMAQATHDSVLAGMRPLFGEALEMNIQVWPGRASVAPPMKIEQEIAAPKAGMRV